MRRFFISAASLFILTLSACFVPRPIISGIEPKIGAGGEALNLKGSGFGNERGDSYIKIAGVVPTASAYISWTENSIQLRIPDFVDSGLVYVYVNDTPSNAALYSDRDSLPKILQTTDDSAKPIISKITPSQASIGALVVISGLNFGATQNGGLVSFSWEAISQAATAPAKNHPDRIEVAVEEFGYEAWSDTEIKVRIPDGALTGSVNVRNAKGQSENFPFTLTGKPGTKTYTEKRSYALSYSVNIEAASVTEPGVIYLWMPVPPTSSAQRDIQALSRGVEPFVENYKGSSLFQIAIETPGSFTISVNYLIDVYAVETQVKTQLIKNSLASPLKERYIKSDSLVPSDREEIIEQATKLVGKEKNPYLKAKKLYDWLISEIDISETNTPADPVSALAEKQADAYDAALLYCAVLRAVGVPAIPIAGYLINPTRTVWRHWWTEFWIDGLGWIPVDPVLGSGAAPPEFAINQDASNYYFGNIDNQRIALSRSLTELEAMDPRGKIVRRDRAPAFQTIWEESVGGIEAYSSLWNDINVTGIY